MLPSGCLLCSEISILFTIYNNIYNIYSKKIKVNNRSRDFLGPEITTSEASAIWPQKDLFPAHGETEHQRWEYKRSSVWKYNLRITGTQYKKIKLAGLSNSFFSSGSSFYPFLPLGCMQSHVLNWLIVNIWWNKQKNRLHLFLIVPLVSLCSTCQREKV